MEKTVARYFIACLEDLVALPSPSDMRAATERDIRMRIGWGHAVRHYHKMVYDHQHWDYVTLLQDELREAEKAAILAGRPWPLGTTDDDVPRLKGVWDLVRPRVKLQTAAFKEYTYTVRGVSESTQNSPRSAKFVSFGSSARNSVVVEERLRGELTRPKLDAFWYACTRLLPLACRNFVPFVRYFSRMLYYSVKKRFFAG